MAKKGIVEPRRNKEGNFTIKSPNSEKKPGSFYRQDETIYFDGTGYDIVASLKACMEVAKSEIYDVEYVTDIGTVIITPDMKPIDAVNAYAICKFVKDQKEEIEIKKPDFERPKGTRKRPEVLSSITPEHVLGKDSGDYLRDISVRNFCYYNRMDLDILKLHYRMAIGDENCGVNYNKEKAKQKLKEYGMDYELRFHPYTSVIHKGHEFVRMAMDPSFEANRARTQKIRRRNQKLAREKLKKRLKEALSKVKKPESGPKGPQASKGMMSKNVRSK
ncbi:MAG: hypothetical protein E7019_01940 [Alphaproteobacteria bacterium]|nr:hypothetical protein [Alphaproteobacteria bacterium]